MGEIDVMSLLPQVSTPTLVLHTREDAVDGGRKMASMIPGARFVPLESANHLLLENEPAWPRFLAEVRSFLA
jgi:pimeloyl-ACP methyl ester carboxylesterase